MEERRKSKRLDLEISIEISKLEENGVTVKKTANVDVTDLSRYGIGFLANQKFEADTYYNTAIRIWTGEVINTVVEIIRREKTDRGYRYGAKFIGLPETEALKVDIYQMVNEKEDA